METKYTTIDTLAVVRKNLGTAARVGGAVATAGLFFTPFALGHLAYEGVRGRARKVRQSLGDYLASGYQTEQ